MFFGAQKFINKIVWGIIQFDSYFSFKGLIYFLLKDFIYFPFKNSISISFYGVQK